MAFPSEGSEFFLDFVKAPCWVFGFPDLPKKWLTHFTRVSQFFEASVQTCDSACEARPAVCHGRAQAREETVAVWAGGHVRVVECIRWSRLIYQASCQNFCKAHERNENNNGRKWVSNFLCKSGNPKSNTEPLQRPKVTRDPVKTFAKRMKGMSTTME